MKYDPGKIKEAIANITAELKGPMDNFDRAWLVAERADLRELLRKIEEPSGDTATAEQTPPA
jgi:hypothetical protein